MAPAPRPALNILKLKARKQGRRHSESHSDYDEEEEDRDLSDFIENDEEEVSDIEKELQRIKRRFGAKQTYEVDSVGSDMEAGYDEIDEEERKAARIARREDYEEELRT